MTKPVPHVYLVKGTPKGKVFPTIGWKVFSYKSIEEFSRLFVDIAPEYNIEVQEIYLREMEILETWDIPAGHWS